MEQDIFFQVITISRAGLITACGDIWRHGKGNFIELV